MQSTITLTFGDQAENHVGMQKIGQLATCGFTYDDLIMAKSKFDNIGCVTEIINLSDTLLHMKSKDDDAYVLVVRGALNALSNNLADLMLNEQNGLEKDKKAFMYGRIVNKHARHNLCFHDVSQEPDYANGKGRLVAFDSVPHLNSLRNMLPEYFGDKSRGLAIEGNYYYDITKCGIGYHGDSERKKVIGVRLGATIPLQFQWFCKCKPIGNPIKIMLGHGDLYVMSEKAVGNDWKLKNVNTLRHAAGADKFLVV